MKDSIQKLAYQLNAIVEELQFAADFYVGEPNYAAELIKDRDAVGEQLRVLLDEYYCSDLRSYRSMGSEHMVMHTARLIAKIRTTKYYYDLVTITESMFKL